MAAHGPIKLLFLKFVLTCWMLAALGGQVMAREGPMQLPSESIALTDLPVQGQFTYQAILKGGPFRYEKDGAVFGNRERRLPSAPRGHYREYTVETPGSRDRGARRIVCAGKAVVPTACWYTADHYASFRRIAPQAVTNHEQ